jgi:hypothetical protein
LRLEGLKKNASSYSHEDIFALFFKKLKLGWCVLPSLVAFRVNKTTGAVELSLVKGFSSPPEKSF